MLGHAIEHAAHHHLRAGGGDIIVKHGRAIGGGKDCLGNVLAHLARIDIDRHHELDIARAIAADAVVNQALR